MKEYSNNEQQDPNESTSDILGNDYSRLTHRFHDLLQFPLGLQSVEQRLDPELMAILVRVETGFILAFNERVDIDSPDRLHMALRAPIHIGLGFVNEIDHGIAYSAQKQPNDEQRHERRRQTEDAVKLVMFGGNEKEWHALRETMVTEEGAYHRTFAYTALRRMHTIASSRQYAQLREDFREHLERKQAEFEAK